MMEKNMKKNIRNWVTATQQIFTQHCKSIYFNKIKTFYGSYESHSSSVSPTSHRIQSGHWTLSGLPKCSCEHLSGLPKCSCEHLLRGSRCHGQAPLLGSQPKVSESLSVVSDSLHPMDYTIHRILHARILEWVAFPFSRGSSQPRDQTQVSHIAGRFFSSCATREAHLGASLLELKSCSNTH